MVASLKFFGRLLKYAACAVFLFLVILLVALVFFEQPVPQVLLARATAALSKGPFLVTAESASFRFSRGVKIRNLRVFEKRRHPLRQAEPVKPMLSATLVDLELNLRRIPWSWDHLLEGVTVTELKYPRLPEGYYVPDSVEFPGQPDFRETDEPVSLNLPALAPFRVTLLRPDILSVAPRFVEVPAVNFTANAVRIPRLSLEWADSDALMVLDGFFELDLERQLVRGQVDGFCRQHNIRPMLVAIDIQNSLPFMDAFTKVESPIAALCRFNVDLRKGDLHLVLDLHPLGGHYRGVPFKSVDGTLAIRVFVRDTYQNAHIKVGDEEKALDVQLADGTRMAGTVFYENTNDVGYVTFDVDSRTSLSNALAIANVMNDGTLDCLAPETTPTVTLKGRLAVDPRHAAANDLRGTVAFARGSIFSVPLVGASGAFLVKGADVTLTNIVAAAPHGGRVTGHARLACSADGSADGAFRVNIACRDVALQDLVDAFGKEPGDRHGKIDADIALDGPMTSNVVTRLGGSGRIVCRDGHLAQMKLFAGLTDYLARNVPGVSGVVNLSRGSMDYTLTNGVLRASDVRVEGSIFSIQARGTYDIVKDDLDFTARLTISRNQGVIDTLATPIKWPVGMLSKMLLDFRIRGSLDNPSWTYNKNLMDRLK